MRLSHLGLFVSFVLLAPCAGRAEPGPLRAGAYAIDITPTQFPVIVNGMFTERVAQRAHDPLFARCLVLDDGTTRLAIVVVDSCGLPRALLDRAKEMASSATGIPTERMLISATHTHSAPSVWGALGSRTDPSYGEFLVPQIARGIELAAKTLRPARVGWAVAKSCAHTHCRRWIFRSDKMRTDPFGGRTVRAHMHPGYQNPDAIGPSGPVDPDLSMLAVQGLDGTPIALVGNYAMHYFGSPILSADCFGRFADHFTKRIGAEKTKPPFVAMLSQGTSGDQMWMDYSQPAAKTTLDEYGAGLARLAHDAYRSIVYHDRASLAMSEKRIALRRRAPDEQRLAWARPIVASLQDRQPQNLPEVYAREQVLLHENPTAELKLQAIRIGELGITAIPDEVFAITGHKIKRQSPLVPTFNIELANGAEGYIPPPEQHKLGGYTTWAARSAGLEVQAEPTIVENVLELLEQVSGKPRRPLVAPIGPYAKAVLDAQPLAYWRLEDIVGPVVQDQSGRNHSGRYEDLIAYYLEGPPSEAFGGAGSINRAAHFAGGRVVADFPRLAESYTVEFWFWNGMPSDVRPVTGYLFSRGADGDRQAEGDHLGVGGTHAHAGKLVFFNGNQKKELLAGKTTIAPKTWHHVVLVRQGATVTVYLDGATDPEISGTAAAAAATNAPFFIGGRCDNFANFEGKIDEVAFYDRALSPNDAAGHYRAAGP